MQQVTIFQLSDFLVAGNCFPVIRYQK